MKTAALFILCLLAFLPNLDAQPVAKIGNYPIAGTLLHKGFVLDDGCIYKPINKAQKKITDGWQVGDQILLLSGKGKRRYILVNMRTGQVAYMKGIRW